MANIFHSNKRLYISKEEMEDIKNWSGASFDETDRKKCPNCKDGR